MEINRSKRCLSIYFLYITICVISNFLYGNPFSTKGQFWASGLTGNDVPAEQSAYESTFGYIPTLSLYQDLSDFSFVDFEWAYRLDRFYSGYSLVSNREKIHRLWARYSSEKLEARLGLQKIVFGPSQILRTLSWFDTIDLKDPTNQTDGVEAFRLKWFPSNAISIWSWAIQNEQDTVSFGGRVELSSFLGELGFTFHSDPSETVQQVGQLGFMISERHQRFAFDIRHDGFVGSWLETAFITSENTDIKMATIGADYTVPISNGLLIMTESMFVKNAESDDQTFTAFMAMLPLGMIHSIMFISQIDWKEDRAYNYLRWSATFDQFSLNLILSQSPQRSDYSIAEEYLPKTVAGFGSGIQFMFIYNH
ncbi:MAG: hypothetical protein HOD97_03910 [Candidatus Marinimicrobia bacterium]|nr:hypothetical protein [Candidatus Neomarinimicrobiota bacterium]MBT3828359.1 hypothetical protein [Candidatus Neomarinimicrobiota bacterium]MBT3997587.1 hypothetical protein [Candidatus Neomarinimicrobiota bacterium]MBT4280748.1 hypothetical protein [Candidatus Neomarinimicrobiota bacterium]MBT4569409.1 hypothetical protein [Candidatus Neomarinimicrobiota bacterium]